VVTGTLVAGEIREGDELELLPLGRRVRVRGLQVHGQGVGRAVAGQRTALNLGGIETSQIERGMVLAETGRLRPSQIMDAQVEVLKSAPRPLRSRSRVRVHLGAAEVLARVRVLGEGGEIGPGETGFVQLRLETPVATLMSERFIIRSYSPARTIAGGRVLNPQAVKHRGRELGEARAALSALMNGDRAAQVAAFVAASESLRRADLLARTGWRDEILEDALRAALESGAVVDAEGLYLMRARFDNLGHAALEEVLAHHRREPLSRGLSRETLRERLSAHAEPEIFRAVLASLERAGSLLSDKEIVRSSTHTLELSVEDAALRDRLEEIYRAARLEVPSLEEALRSAAGVAKTAPEHVRKILHRLLDAGVLVRVQPDLLFHREALDLLVRNLRAYAAEHEPERLIDVAAFKDLAGVTRKYAIPLLEYLDRERITQRAGDRRRIT